MSTATDERRHEARRTIDILAVVYFRGVLTRRTSCASLRTLSARNHPGAAMGEVLGVWYVLHR